MNYETESKFSKALINKFKRAGMDVTRLESHSTINGLPDMFVQGMGIDAFVELKNVKANIQDKVKIAWRPGQQAFARNYFTCHNCSKCTLTIVAFKDAILVIRMIKIFTNDIVDTNDTEVCIKFDEAHWKTVDLMHLVAAFTDVYVPSFKNTSMYAAVKEYADATFKPVLNEADVSLEILWKHAITIHNNYSNNKIEYSINDRYDPAVFKSMQIILHEELRDVWCDQF